MNLSDIFPINSTELHRSTVYGSHTVNYHEVAQDGPGWQKWLDNSQVTISTIGKSSVSSSLPEDTL